MELKPGDRVVPTAESRKIIKKYLINRDLIFFESSDGVKLLENNNHFESGGCIQTGAGT